jgi:tetratricopeptide (TPR) repeat protein
MTAPRTLLCGAVVVALALTASVAGVQAAGRFGETRMEEGRRHAQKANRLSAAGKCKQAVLEFSAAYRILGDPALLFNRAECLRKLGQTRRALGDYRRFLVELPNAPNRRAVELRIAALEGRPPPPLPVEAPRAAIAKQVPPPAASPAPVAVAEPPPRDPLVPEPAVPADQSTAPSLPAVPTTADESRPPPLMRLDEPGAGEPEEAPRSSRVSPWVWVGLGALVVAGG